VSEGKTEITDVDCDRDLDDCDRDLDDCDRDLDDCDRDLDLDLRRDPRRALHETARSAPPKVAGPRTAGGHWTR